MLSYEDKVFLDILYHEAEGKQVTGRYFGCDFIGTISDVRVAYGGDLSITIDFADDEHIFIGGTDERDGIILSGNDFLKCASGTGSGSGIAENLQVYL